jgi:hypothetical protein
VGVASGILSGGLLLLVAACGATSQSEPSRSASPAPDSETPAEAPSESAGLSAASSNDESAESGSESPSSEAPELELPLSCTPTSSGLCTPPDSFVRAACSKSSVELALAMFRKATPWTRAYLRLRTEAWYTGNRRAAPVQLELDEEVLIVADRGADRAGGAQIVGASSYDVYRWDGRCASLMADEVTLRRPPLPRAAAIPWRRLGDETRQALLKNPGIKRHQGVVRQRCSEDSTAQRCTEAADALTQLIAGYVRRGGELPEPKLVLR